MNLCALGLMGIFAGLLMIVSGLDLHWHGAIAMATGLFSLGAGIRALRSRDSDTETAHFAPQAEPGRYQRFADTPADTEVPFLVLVPHRATTPEQLRAIGKATQSWKATSTGVGRILGLDKMLEGQLPESGVVHFGISYWEDPRSQVVSVALVFVARRAFHQGTEESLKQALAGLPVTLMDPEYYGLISR